MQVTLREKINENLYALRTARERVKLEKEALVDLEVRVEALRQAQSIAQQVAESLQNRAHEQVTEIVTKCLSTIFDDPYTFRILFERKRGKTEARLVFERDGEILDPLSSAAGAAVNVASFALRLACILLSAPKKRKLVILDEPFRFVAPRLHGRVRSLLEALADELGVQILIVTHDEGLRAGLVHALTIR